MLASVAAVGIMPASGRVVPATLLSLERKLLVRTAKHVMPVPVVFAGDVRDVLEVLPAYVRLLPSRLDVMLVMSQ